MLSFLLYFVVKDHVLKHIPSVKSSIKALNVKGQTYNGNKLDSTEKILFDRDTGMLLVSNTVCKIYGHAYSNLKGLRAIKFQKNSNLISIGAHSFESTGITKLILPDTVIRIGIHAFKDCFKLTLVKLPKSMSNECFQLFGGCNNLKTNYYSGTTSFDKDIISINISEVHLLATTTRNHFSRSNIGNIIRDLPERITEPEDFKYDYDKKELVVGNVTNITQADLQRVVGFYEITFDDIVSCFISKGVKFVNQHAFGDCTSIEDLVFEEGSNFTIEEYGFANLAIRSLDIADTMTFIRGFAFNNCKNLEFVKLPKSLYPSTYYLFPQCNMLRTVYYCGPCHYFQYLLFGVEFSIHEVHLQVGSELDEFQNYYNKIIKDLDEKTCRPFGEIRTSPPIQTPTVAKSPYISNSPTQSASASSYNIQTNSMTSPSESKSLIATESSTKKLSHHEQTIISEISLESFYYQKSSNEFDKTILRTEKVSNQNSKRMKAIYIGAGVGAAVFIIIILILIYFRNKHRLNVSSEMNEHLKEFISI